MYAVLQDFEQFNSHTR